MKDGATLAWARELVAESVIGLVHCRKRAEGRWWRASCLELYPHMPIPRAPRSTARRGMTITPSFLAFWFMFSMAWVCRGDRGLWARLQFEVNVF